MKNKEQVLEFNLKLKNRVKEGLLIAAKAARLAEQFGTPTEDGFKYNFYQSTVKIIYDTLNFNVFIDQGNQFAFKANTKLKTVSVFRGSSWIGMLESEYKKKFPSEEVENEDFVNLHSGMLQDLMGLKFYVKGI